METKYKLSFPDSKRILDEAVKRDLAIDSLLYKHFAFDSRKAAVKAVNDLLFETATKTGASLYDLCFRTVPVWGHPILDIKDAQNLDLKTELRLEPVEFDFTHDGGYWRNKYFELKKAMQEVIDSKEDELKK